MSDTPKTGAGEENLDLQDKAISFPLAIPGFSHCKRFILNQLPSEKPFFWLRSLDDANLAFAVMEAHQLIPDYSFEVDDEELSAIGSPDPRDCAVFFIVRLEELQQKKFRLHANPRAPLLINMAKRIGRQVIVVKGSNYEEGATFDL